MSRNYRSDLGRQNPEVKMEVHGESLNHMPYVPELHVSYLISQKSKKGSGFRGMRATHIIHELPHIVCNILQKILWDLEKITQLEVCMILTKHVQ